MKPYQQRVVDERQSLDEKAAKLRAFMSGKGFLALDAVERDRLTRQIKAMEAYSAVLAERIEAFRGEA